MITLQLREYQKQGIEFLKSRNRALLFDEPGLGKTCQALMSIGRKAVVICPKSVKAVWASECLKFRPDLKPRIIEGRNKFIPPGDGELVIMNPAILPEHWGILDDDAMVIVDECHSFKNVKTQQSKRLAMLSHHWSGKIIGMSGTPIMRDPMDFFGVLHSLNLVKETYKNFSTFVRLFSGFQVQYGWTWGKPKEGAMDSVKPYILGRKRIDVAKDIPPKVYEEYRVTVKSKDPPVRVDEIAEESKRDGKLATWRRQVGIEKAAAALEYISEVNESEPVVVFCAHRDACAVFEKAGFPVITGETSESERKKIVDKFQAGEISKICGTIGAMSVGITLTRAHRLFMVERDWTPALNLQAEDRICRIGSTANQCIITDIVANSPMDEIIHRVLKRKQQLIDLTIEKERVRA